MNLLDPSTSSFRDPSGNVFLKDGIVQRNVNFSYKENYDLFMKSGLYKKLVDENLLISHVEVKLEENSNYYKILQPQQLKFISYPYEWSFSQLKEAALTLLKIQKIAFEHGMVLKDASAYNMQWHMGKFILIDTLSFEIYQENKPWIAYKQFCEHFFAPLALMTFCDIRSNELLKVYLDGIPIQLAKAFLPKKSKLNLAVLMHIHLHASSIKKGGDAKKSKSKKFTKLAFKGLIDNFESAITKFKLNVSSSTWHNYYSETILSNEYLEQKKVLVKEYLNSIKYDSVLDVGANTGEFSLLVNPAALVVSTDFDNLAVEDNYLFCKKNNIKNILPLVTDFTNPSPAIGWKNSERASFVERVGVDCVMALAVVHHLAIGKNIPLQKIAELFCVFTTDLIIEFVPKTDPKALEMLEYREDIFSNYSIENFEAQFSPYFSIEKKAEIPNSTRTLYLMRKKANG